jgi:K+-sensing histidine kinase KdpD
MASERLRSDRTNPVFDPLIAPLGAIAAMATAALMTPLRETAFGNTNAALVLVVIVAAAASLGGRGAGAVTAFIAALSYNFLLTRPYLSLHVADATDVTTVVLLLVVGLVIGEFARSRAHRLGQLRRSAESTHRLERIARLMVSDLDQPALCEAVTAEISSELGLAGATWCAAAPTGDRPLMTASGWVDAGGTLHHRPGGFELPRDGVELPVSYAGARLGTIVMTPQTGVGVSPDQRRVAVALADLLASALARGNAARASI